MSESGQYASAWTSNAALDAGRPKHLQKGTLQKGTCASMAPGYGEPCGQTLQPHQGRGTAYLREQLEMVLSWARPGPWDPSRVHGWPQLKGAGGNEVQVRLLGANDALSVVRALTRCHLKPPISHLSALELLTSQSSLMSPHPQLGGILGEERATAPWLLHNVCRGEVGGWALALLVKTQGKEKLLFLFHEYFYFSLLW